MSANGLDNVCICPFSRRGEPNTMPDLPGELGFLRTGGRAFDSFSCRCEVLGLDFSENSSSEDKLIKGAASSS